MLGKGKYEKYTSNWFAANLPSSKEGMVIQDVDFVLSNYKTKKFMFVEVKTKNNQVSYPERQFYSMMHRSLVKTELVDGREYIGTHLLRFEHTSFDDGDVSIDGNYMNEINAIKFFNFELGFDNE